MLKYQDFVLFIFLENLATQRFLKYDCWSVIFMPIQNKYLFFHRKKIWNIVYCIIQIRILCLSCVESNVIIASQNLTQHRLFFVVLRFNHRQQIGNWSSSPFSSSSLSVGFFNFLQNFSNWLSSHLHYFCPRFNLVPNVFCIYAFNQDFFVCGVNTSEHNSHSRDSTDCQVHKDFRIWPF